MNWRTFWYRDKRIDAARFPGPVWLIFLLLFALIWLIWPFFSLVMVKRWIDLGVLQLVSIQGLAQFGDIFGAFSALATSITLAVLVLGRFEQGWSEDNNFVINKTSILLQLIEAVDQGDSQEVFYKIEYKDLKYNGEFHRSEEERKLDKLLYTLDVICLQFYRNVLNKDDMKYFDYKIVKILENEDVTNYIRAIELMKSYLNIEYVPNLQKYYNEVLLPRKVGVTINKKRKL